MVREIDEELEMWCKKKQTRDVERMEIREVRR